MLLTFFLHYHWLVFGVSPIEILRNLVHLNYFASTTCVPIFKVPPYWEPLKYRYYVIFQVPVACFQSYILRLCWCRVYEGILIQQRT